MSSTVSRLPSDASTAASSRTRTTLPACSVTYRLRSPQRVAVDVGASTMAISVSARGGALSSEGAAPGPSDGGASPHGAGRTLASGPAALDVLPLAVDAAEPLSLVHAESM